MADGESRQEQLNLRLSRAHYDILDAVAYLDETNRASVVRTVIEEYLQDRLGDEDVQLLLAIRKRHRGLDAVRSPTRGVVGRTES